MNPILITKNSYCCILVPAFVLMLAVLWGCSPPGDTETSSAPAHYVSEETCAGCHETENKAWSGSHHDLAMQDANEQTVLGDFQEAQFSYAGVTSRFFRRESKFFVNTDGPDGKLADYEIKHTFGVEPLQQYLIELPGGRLQALSIAWDTQQKRWFHLYPNERVDHKDELHWTRLSQNWNHMCGECHATNYRKNYDMVLANYKTVADRFDVGCQSCHGPASRHMAWANRAKTEAKKSQTGTRRLDFTVDLTAQDSRIQIETCARCHSRRSTLSADYQHGARLMDTHLPALLTEQLYFADGQIQDEVYVYGSFLQSRMQAKGMRCSDCHEPHSTKTRARGNALCVSCHNETVPNARTHIDTSGLKQKNYDSSTHHFHKADKVNIQCIDCHAPARNYMVVDPRHDHSFRIPRPDLSVRIGTPNACNVCHDKQTPKWAAEAVARWYSSNRQHVPHYGEALHAGRYGKAGAVAGLIALTDDNAQPAIVRATALDLLGRYPGQSALAALQRGLKDTDPLVRRIAAIGQERLPPEQRTALLLPLLADPVRAVRMETARLLVSVQSTLNPEDIQRLKHALTEFESAQLENADSPEAHINLGNLYLERAEIEQAEQAYRKAIALDSQFVPAYVNLADLYRAMQRNMESEQVLREGLLAAPKSASLHEALGLALVRQGNKDAALAEFAAATKAAPDNPRHAYIYAVALDGVGRRAEAIQVLKGIVKNRGDRNALLALASFAIQSGDRATAEQAIGILVSINPDDPALGAATPGP